MRMSNGRLRTLPMCCSALFIRSAVGTGLHGHLRRNLHQFHVPVFIQVHGRFSEIHLPNVLKVGDLVVPPPPPLVVGSSILTDPRGEPLPSNQSFVFRPLAVRRHLWRYHQVTSQCLLGLPTRHINGKVTSTVGQRVAL